MACPRTRRAPGRGFAAPSPALGGNTGGPPQAAGALPGDQGAVAVFEADLPEAGRWRLDFHVPEAEVPMSFGAGPDRSWRVFGALGPMVMRLVLGETEARVDFDAGAAEPGWNKLGDLEIGAQRTVRLEVTTQTSGEMVIADAIRWTPAG